MAYFIRPQRMITTVVILLTTSHCNVDSFQVSSGIPQNGKNTISINRLHQKSIPSDQYNTGFKYTPLHMVKYEDMLEKLPSKVVLDVVEQSPRKDAVIASDIASAAGISLSQARKDLTTLAALARADLAVTNGGELIYSFPENLKSVLAQNSAKYQVLQYVEKAWPLVFWFVRVSFGVALLASLVAIFSTIIFIQSSSSNSDERRRDDRGGGMFGGGFGGYWGPSPFDVFFYRPYGYYGYYGTGADYRDPDDMGFLESIFSYLFGDGNPNAGLEERRLALAASVIRQSNGAVTAEQLAPFCDDAPSPSTVESSTYADETFVLPIVSALGGEPIVTDDGNIIYVFSELQTTAGSSSVVPTPNQSSMPQEARILKRAGMKAGASSREIMQVLNYNRISTRGVVDKSDLIRLLEQALPPMSPAEEAEALNADTSVLLEQEIKFSVAPDLNKFLAGALGVVNLGGALYLGNLLSQIADYGYRLPSYFGTVQALYPFLLGYAVLFNIIPALRNIYINAQNTAIQLRNERRRSWQRAMANAISSNNRISQKLKSAKIFQTKVRKISASDVVYDTKQSIEDMKLGKDEVSLAEFDKLLENSDGNSFQ